MTAAALQIGEPGASRAHAHGVIVVNGKGRKVFIPDPVVSPWHQRNRPSRRNTPLRDRSRPQLQITPEAKHAALFWAGVLDRKPQNHEAIHPRTYIRNVSLKFEIPAHLRGMWSVICEQADPFTCVCDQQSYDMLGSPCGLDRRAAIYSVAELEAFHLVDTEVGPFQPGVGNVPNLFFMRLPQALLDEVGPQLPARLRDVVGGKHRNLPQHQLDFMDGLPAYALRPQRRAQNPLAPTAPAPAIANAADTSVATPTPAPVEPASANGDERIEAGAVVASDEHIEAGAVVASDKRIEAGAVVAGDKRIEAGAGAVVAAGVIGNVVARATALAVNDTAGPILPPVASEEPPLAEPEDDADDAAAELAEIAAARAELLDRCGPAQVHEEQVEPHRIERELPDTISVSDADIDEKAAREVGAVVPVPRPNPPVPVCARPNSSAQALPGAILKAPNVIEGAIYELLVELGGSGLLKIPRPRFPEVVEHLAGLVRHFDNSTYSLRRVLAALEQAATKDHSDKTFAAIVSIFIPNVREPVSLSKTAQKIVRGAERGETAATWIEARGPP